MNIPAFIEKAKTSKARMWLLNRILYRLIPFNKPHGFTIKEIGDDYVKVVLPYKRKNLNHIKGLHACALATLAEYSTGFLMITRLDPKKFRIIMQRIEMDYHYQGKNTAACTFKISNEQIKEDILEPLKDKESVIFKCKPEIYDSENNHLASGHVFWQVKSWEKVKTKV
ncbi:MAG: DUF4442 domain-containing protein [Candidatus Cyclobacteriaceae bacterium M2_1C_046]